MPGVLALFAAVAALAQPATTLNPARLPELPARGLATSGCGSAAKAGVYTVTLQGKRRLLVPTPRFAYYWMWGG